MIYWKQAQRNVLAALRCISYTANEMIVSVIVDHFLLSFLLSALSFVCFLNFLTIMIVRTSLFLVTIRVTIISASIFSNDPHILIGTGSYVTFTSVPWRFSIYGGEIYIFILWFCNLIWIWVIGHIIVNIISANRHHTPHNNNFPAAILRLVPPYWIPNTIWMMVVMSCLVPGIQ